MFLPELFMPDDLDWGVNYGLDRVRFPAPVVVNSRIRGVGELISATRIADNAVQTMVRMTVEIEDRPIDFEALFTDADVPVAGASPAEMPADAPAEIPEQQ